MNRFQKVIKLKNLITRERTNILLFGESGTGKSSIINLLSSDEERVVRMAEVRAGDMGQKTLKYRKYKFNNNVSVFDTWGWFPKVDVHILKGLNDAPKGGLYTPEFFINLLRGIVKDGHHMKEEIRIHDPQINDMIIDAVIFVLPANIEQTKSSLILPQMKIFYEVARARKLPVFVVLTKMDIWYNHYFKQDILMEKDPKMAIKKIVRNEHYETLVKIIIDELGENTQIFPIINYTHLCTYPNNVRNYMCQLFVNKLCFEIQRNQELLGGDFFHQQSSKNSPNRQPIQPSLTLYKDETPNNLTFKEMPDGRVESTETFISGGNQEDKFAIYETFFNLLQLGRLVWRYFLVESRITGFCRLSGLYNPDLDIYFESLNAAITTGLVNYSFDSNHNVQNYCFLDSVGGDPTPVFNFQRTRYVKITLARDNFIILKRRERTNFHTLLLNLFQEKKEVRLLNSKLNLALMGLQKREEEKDKKMEILMKEMEELKRIIIQSVNNRQNQGNSNNNNNSNNSRIRMVPNNQRIRMVPGQQDGFIDNNNNNNNNNNKRIIAPELVQEKMILIFHIIILLHVSSCSWVIARKDSHMNALSVATPKTDEFELEFPGFVFNGELTIDEVGKTLILTVTEVNDKDNTTSELILEIDINSGKEVHRTLIKKGKTTPEYQWSYGGLIVDQKYLFIKSADPGDIWIYDLTTKEIIENKHFVLKDSPLNLPIFTYEEENLVFANITSEGCKNGSFQCFRMVSVNLATMEYNWETEFLISDDCRSSEYEMNIDNSGTIFLMSDSCGKRNNQIYKINSKDGKLIKKLDISSGTISSSSKITVSNIEEEGLKNYYFAQKSRKDRKTFVFAMDKSTDQIMWKEEIKGTEFKGCSNLALSYDGKKMTIVCPGAIISVMYIIDAKTGKKELTKTIFDGFCISSLILKNGRIIVSCDNLVTNVPKIYVFDENGKEIKKFEHSKMQFEQFPIVDSSNNMYYCFTNYTSVKCFKKSIF